MPSTIPRASMKDEQWVSTFGTASKFGQENIQDGDDERWKKICQHKRVYEALLKIRRIYQVKIDWVLGCLPTSPLGSRQTGKLVFNQQLVPAEALVWADLLIGSRYQ